jgi:uncharacterized protein YajQ (UPF0234 family)
VICITEIELKVLQTAARSDGRSLSRRFDMKNHERELSEGVDLLSDDELDAVSGGDQVAHLPQSIHIDYGKLSIDQNPTRLA